MPSLFSTIFEYDRGHCVYCGRNLLTDFDSFYMAQRITLPLRVLTPRRTSFLRSGCTLGKG